VELAELSWRDRVAVVTCGDEQRKNALGAVFWPALASSLQVAQARPDTRALILVGRGSHFSSGMDLSPSDPLVASFAQAMQSSPQALNTALDGVQAVLGQLSTLPFPTIAAVEGHCLGGGLELALACDLRVCAAGARLAFPETRRGLTPNLGGVGRLLTALGQARALPLLLACAELSGAEAVACGLAQRGATDGRALDAALELAAAIACSGPNAVQAVLSVVRAASEVPVATRAAERAASLRVLASGEPLAGLTAFFEKRPAPWT
jgi:enoyl-CoA hydratase/carnithine racemase